MSCSPSIASRCWQYGRPASQDVSIQNLCCPCSDIYPDFLAHKAVIACLRRRRHAKSGGVRTGLSLPASPLDRLLASKPAPGRAWGAYILGISHSCLKSSVGPWHHAQHMVVSDAREVLQHAYAMREWPCGVLSSLSAPHQCTVSDFCIHPQTSHYARANLQGPI